MKRATVFLCVAMFFAVSSKLFAQVGNWYPQLVPSIVGQLYDIDMYNTQFGAAVGIPNPMALTWTGVLMTYDGGNTWEPIMKDRFDPPMPDYAVWRTVHILNEMNIVIAGDSGLVYTTTDGGFTWRDKSPTLKLLGPMRPTLRSVYFKDAHEGYVVGGDRDAPMPPPPPPPIQPALPNTPIIYKTTDFGKTWTDESPLPGALYGNPRMFSVKYGSGVWLACGEFSTVIQRATSTWSALTKPSVNPYELYRQINIVDANNWSISGSNPGINAPRYYQTNNAGARWLNNTPNNYPAGVEDFPSHFIFSPTQAWVGSSMAYLAATTTGGPVWKNFLVAGVTAPGTLEKLDFTDPLNGWACGDGWIIRYFGVPPKADISKTQRSAFFPDITCERTVEITVTVRNTGTGELIVPTSGVSFSSSEFSAPGLILPFKLLPGRGKQITVRWTPGRTSYGTVQASMTVLSNDPDHGVWDIALEGKRIYGSLDIASTIDVYPSTCIKDSVDYTQYVSTGGNRPPTFIGIEFVSGNNEFRLLSPKPGTVINGTQPFFFRFYPTQSGLRKATFRVISGNTSCPDTTFFDINGTGDRTKLVSNVTEVDFGKVCINTIRDTTITLTNIGNTYAFVERRELKSGVDMFPTLEIIPLMIKVDSSKQYRVQFTPQLTGTFTAEYRIINSPCPDTVIVRFKGEGISTELTFNPRGSVTVGPTFVNRQVTRVVSVRNSGKTPANITSVRLAKLFPDLVLTSVPPLPILLLPGNSFDVTLVFNPQNIEVLETQLLVAFNSTCSDTARLDVIAPCLPNPYIDPPAAMDVGLQPCSKAIRDTLFIRNRGNGPLVFLSASFTGANPTHFKLISPAIGDSIRAKDSIRLVVEYDRTTEGSSNAGLFLNHNDLDHLPTFIALTGRRIVSEFTVFGDSATEFFTRIFVPQTRRYTLRNTSNQTVTITATTVQKGAAVYTISPSTPLPVTLAPNGSTEIDVIFTPNGRGPFNGLIRFTSQPCGYTSLLSVNGRGDTEGLSVDRGNIDFALDPCSFTSMCDTLHLSNQGGNPVTVTGLSITQTGTLFTMTPPISVPFTLQGNQTQDVIICADPAYFGSGSGTLNIKSTDPVVPSINVALMYHRDSSNVTASVSEIDFGRMLHCSNGFTRDVTVTNNGTVQEVINASLGGHSGAFTSTAPASILLQPGKTFTFTVAFTHPAFGGFVDTLRLFTERCMTETSIVVRGAWIEQIYAAAPKPLVFPSVNIGTSSIRPLNIQNNGGFDAHIASVTVNPPGEFIVQPGYPATIAAGNSITAQLRFTPASEGPKAASVCVIFDAPCADTLCVDLQGTGVRGRIILSRATMSFGTLAQCQLSTIADTLTNGGTGTINLLSATITGNPAFTNLTPVAATEPLAPGNTRVFRIQYDASAAPADGAVLANLQIVTDDPIQPVVDIPLDAVRETVRPDGGSSLAFGLVEVGKSSQRTWTLRNTGTARLCYSADRKPAEITYTPALPFCIDPGKTLDITVTFAPTTSGVWTGKLVLLTTSPCADSTVFNLDGRAQQGTIGIASVVDFGSDAWCVGHTQQITITNTYLEDITLDSLRISGVDRTFFTVQTPTVFPRTIAAGGSLSVTLAFAGQNANRTYSAALTSYFTSLGSPVTKFTTLTATTAAPSLTVTSVAFGTAVIGQAPVQGTASVRNSSTIPVRVETLTPSNPAFIVRSTIPALPATLQPGETLTAQLEFAPTQARSFVDSLKVESSQPCPFNLYGALTGSAIPQPFVRATISSGSIDGTPGQFVNIPILVDKDLAGASVTTWKGSVSFNRSMLYPTRYITAGTSSAGMSITMNYMHDSGKVELLASGGTATAGSLPLLFLECQVLLGDAVQTPLHISADFDFTTGYATVIGRNDGVFTLVGYCVSNGRLVTDRSANMLMQNRPNPVSLDNAPSTSISYSIAGDGFVELSLFDVMGRRVRKIVGEYQSKGQHEIRVDVSGLPAGIYQYTLSTGDFLSSRKLIVTR